ncbi:hypothetical protein BKA62DRAFT_826388 [Auriculariales sp. MPI-PUGE-AT-0066]|nr:hypothetical protein BKA62DRAFT_826388 [Auriculariales sp. MPI-PUGE-AT-0066]
MTRERIKTYGRKRGRGASSASSDEPPEQSSTPPLQGATISLEDMTRKMRRRANRASNACEGNAPNSLGSPVELDEPAPKRPKLARKDAVQPSRPYRDDDPLSDGPILADLSPPRRRSLKTATRNAKENRSRRSKAGLAPSFLQPAANTLASPVRLASSANSTHRRPLGHVSRHSFASGKTIRRGSNSDKRRPSVGTGEASRSALGSRTRRQSAQISRKRPSNSWLVSSPSRLNLFSSSSTSTLPPIPTTKDADNSANILSFVTGRPTAFSTPKKALPNARSRQQDLEDDMQIDPEPPSGSTTRRPSFLLPDSDIDASRITHNSDPTPFGISASISAIRPDSFSRFRSSQTSVRFAEPEVDPTQKSQEVPQVLNKGKGKASPHQKTPPHRTNPISPSALPSPASSNDGDELRDLFNVMGLDEEELWERSDSSLNLLKSLSSSTRKKSRGLNTMTHTKSKPPLPTIKMRRLPEPLTAPSDEDDELLLKDGHMWTDD